MTTKVHYEIWGRAINGPGKHEWWVWRTAHDDDDPEEEFLRASKDLGKSSYDEIQLVKIEVATTCTVIKSSIK